MTPTPNFVWCGTLIAAAPLLTAVGSGCGPGVGDGCSDTLWLLLPNNAEPVEPWQSRVEFQLVLSLTTEGEAADPSGDIWPTAQLQFEAAAWPAGGSIHIDRLGIERTDGAYGASDSDPDGDGQYYVQVAALNDCGAGECTREFRAWVEISDIAPGGASLNARSDLRAGFRNPECAAGDPAWLLHDVRRIEEAPDASTPLPDGGRGG